MKYTVLFTQLIIASSYTYSMDKTQLDTLDNEFMACINHCIQQYRPDFFNSNEVPTVVCAQFCTAKYNAHVKTENQRKRVDMLKKQIPVSSNTTRVESTSEKTTD